MRPSWVDRLEKAGFVLGVAVLAFLYGFATHRFGWPPSSLLERAWRQGRATAAGAPDTPPDFTEARAHTRHGVRVVSPDDVQPGLTLISSVWERDGVWNPELRLVDLDGDVVHSWRLAPEEVFEESENRRTIPLDELDFQGSHLLLPDGDVLVNVEYVGTVRMAACGQIRWSLPAGSHHSIEPAPGGGFWIPGVTRGPRRGSPGHPDGFPGLPPAVFQDQLLRVSADGEVLQTVNVLDVLYANDLQRQIRKSGFHDEIDVTHVNDIEPLSPALADEHPLFEAADVAVSVKNLDLVFVVDPASGRVKWHATDPFIKQHDPDFLEDGWIGVFDNNTDGTFRGSLHGGSRIVALRPHSDSVRILFPTPKSERFYTFQRGKWQHLPNGNLLLTESVAGRILEVTADGRTVWEWIAPPYSATRTPYVSQGTRTSLTRRDVAEWSCAAPESIP